MKSYEELGLVRNHGESNQQEKTDCVGKLYGFWTVGAMKSYEELGLVRNHGECNQPEKTSQEGLVELCTSWLMTRLAEGCFPQPSLGLCIVSPLFSFCRACGECRGCIAA